MPLSDPHADATAAVFSRMYDCVRNEETPTLDGPVTREAAVDALGKVAELFEKEAAEADVIGGRYAEHYGPQFRAKAARATAFRDQIVSVSASSGEGGGN